MEIIELEELTDIAEMLITSFTDLDLYDNTISVVANRDLIGYVMNEVLSIDEFTIRKIDLEIDEHDFPYMISISKDKNITVEPIEVLTEAFSDADIVYISMEGDIDQYIIDYCLNRDKKVILFGLEDEPARNCSNCRETSLDTDDTESTHISRDKDGNILGFTKSWSTNNGDTSYYSSYSHYSTDKSALKEIAKNFGVKL